MRLKTLINSCQRCRVVVRKEMRDKPLAEVFSCGLSLMLFRIVSREVRKEALCGLKRSPCGFEKESCVNEIRVAYSMIPASFHCEASALQSLIAVSFSK